MFVSWDSIGDYLLIFGGLNVVVLTIFIIFATHYKFSKQNATKCKENAPEKEVKEENEICENEKKEEREAGEKGEEKKEEDNEKEEEKKEEREVDKKEEDSSKGVEKEVASLARLCGYSAGHMKELSQCALFFQKFSEEQDKITFGRNRNQQREDISPRDAGNNVDPPDIDEEEEIDISDLDVDDISIEEDNDDCDISAEAMADIEAEMMNSSIIMAPTSEEENTSKESNLVPEKNEKVEKVSNNLEKEDAGCKVEEMVKLYVDRLVERAEVEARTQMAEDKRDSISTHPSPFNNIHEAASTLSSDEVNEERRVQEAQLSNILEVMQQNPDMFGRMSEDEINKQVNLYCI
ncbi:uncharacterized protein LOC100182574 isoform X2 [Ciona intestinalis]